jgi:uncharacterized protein
MTTHNAVRYSSGGGRGIIRDDERCYNEFMATQRKIKVTSLDEIKELIQQHKPELRRQFHVEKIGIFGSYARGKQRKTSDIDFLVTFDMPVSYFTLGGLYAYLKDIVGADVDVVPVEDLRSEFRENVLKEVVYL